MKKKSDRLPHGFPCMAAKKPGSSIIAIFLVIFLWSASHQAHGASLDSTNQVLKKLTGQIITMTATPLSIDNIIVYPAMHRKEPGFGDRLEVHLKNGQLLKSIKGNVVLYMDNYCLKNNIGQRVNDNVYNFILNNNSDSVFWKSQFLNAKAHKGIVTDNLAVGSDDGALVSQAQSLKIEIYRPGWITFSWCAFAVIVVLLIWMGKQSNILREFCECGCDETVKKKKRPFSLGRTQMAFWTTIVTFAFLYIYFATGYIPSVSNTTFILLGISASTTALGYIIDNITPDSVPNSCCSRGFWIDILSDNGVPGIHRFQNIIFTLLFGLIYLYNIAHNLQMTEFSTNLLLLMGISNGTYIGIKFVVSQPSANPKPTGDPAK